MISYECDNYFSYPSWYGEYTLFPEHTTSKGSIILELWEMTQIHSHLEINQYSCI